MANEESRGNGEHPGADPEESRAQLVQRGLEWLRWEQIVGSAGVPVSSPGPVAPGPPVVRPAAASSDDRLARLRVLGDEASACTRCELSAGRTKSVFARGNANAELVFVGEGPGYNEDQEGVPFVGKAGQLLDKMISAMGVRPADVYICNVVKCRPPENRTPLANEASACAPFLVGQLEVVAPKVIVALGRCAAENLGAVEPEGRDWRGKWTEWRGVPVLSTYHPAYLLRNEEMKRPVWEDLQSVMARLGWGRA